MNATGPTVWQSWELKIAHSEFDYHFHNRTMEVICIDNKSAEWWRKHNLLDYVCFSMTAFFSETKFKQFAWDSAFTITDYSRNMKWQRQYHYMKVIPSYETTTKPRGLVNKGQTASTIWNNEIWNSHKSEKEHLWFLICKIKLYWPGCFSRKRNEGC